MLIQQEDNKLLSSTANEAEQAQRRKQRTAKLIVIKELLRAQIWKLSRQLDREIRQPERL